MSSTYVFRHEYWQHMTSGDIYAVELDADGLVMASFGPVHPAMLDQLPGEFWLTPDDNEWFVEEDERAGDTGAWRLMEYPELMQRRARALDADSRPA